MLCGTVIEMIVLETSYCKNGCCVTFDFGKELHAPLVSGIDGGKVAFESRNAGSCDDE